MADLLECVLQIKGLRETLGRVQARVDAARSGPANPAVSSELRLLLAAEEKWQGFLATALGDQAREAVEGARDEVKVSGMSEWDTQGLAAAFCRARLLTLRLLDKASAADFAVVAELTGRGRTTVADCVAVMLAHDTDRLGDMQRAVIMAAPYAVEGGAP